MTANQGMTGQAANGLMARAVGLHQARRFPEAIALYLQILMMDPDNQSVRTNYAIALLESNQPDKAVDALRRVVAADPGSADARSYLGNALQMAGDPEAAEAAYREALEVAPGDSRTHNNLGVLLRATGRNREAAKYFRRALSNNPEHVQAQNNLCQTLIDLGRIDEAIAAGRQTVAMDPGHVVGLNSLGVALMQGDRIDEAIAAFHGALRLRPDYFDAFSNLALALIIGGEPAEAVKATDHALEAVPGNVEALANRSVALSQAGEQAALAALVDDDRLIGQSRVDPGADFADLAGFNDDLAGRILEHPTLGPAAARDILRTGDLLVDAEGAMARLKRIIADAVEAYVTAMSGDAHPFLPRKPAGWDLEAWATVLGPGVEQLSQIHKSGWISGIYCVRAADAVSAPDDGHRGWLEFGRPQAVYRATAEPDLRLVHPEDGLLVLFPSFFFHRFIPFEAEAEHISIAFIARASPD